MTADVPGPRQTAHRIAKDAYGVVLRVAHERRNPTVYPLLLEQRNFEIDDLAHLVSAAGAQTDVEQSKSFALLLVRHVDQPQAIARGVLWRTVVPDVTAVVAERQSGRAALHLVQRRQEVHGGRCHAARRRGRTIGGAQIKSGGHDSRLRTGWYYLKSGFAAAIDVVR